MVAECPRGSGPPINPASPSIFKAAATKDVAMPATLTRPGGRRLGRRGLEGKGKGEREQK